MPEPFEPFTDDTSTLTVGGLTVENGTDHITLSGSLDLARDRQGLDQAKALQSALNEIITALEAEKALPAKAAQASRTRTTQEPNPFA